MTDLPVDKIVVRDRIRGELGDINALASNIAQVGLLHPVVVSDRNVLIAGRRRLEAFRQLGRKTIPVTVAPLTRAMHGAAEASENVYRLQFNPIEAERAYRAMLPLEAADAEMRRRKHGGSAPGRAGNTGGKFPPVKEDNLAAARAARVVGYSRPTMEKVSAIVAAAKEDGGHYGQMAERLNRPKAKVDSIYSEFKRTRASLALPKDPPTEYGLGEILLLNRDFLTLTEEAVPPGSVDIIVTSPPYNLAKPYGVAGDDLPEADYMAFTEAWGRKALELLRPGGRLCVNLPLDVGVSDRDIPLYAEVVHTLRSVGLGYIYSVVWDKGNVANSRAYGSYAMPTAPAYQSGVEMIAILYRDWWRRSNGTVDLTEDEFAKWTKRPWTFPGQPIAQANGHPAPFPVELPKRCLKLFGFIGDTVLDPFVGSGSTLLACRELGRRGIGVEIDPVTCRLAAERIGVTSEVPCSAA